MRLCFATADFFLDEALTVTLGVGVGVGTGFLTGDRRNADGEGIVIVAIEFDKPTEATKECVIVVSRKEIAIVCDVSCGPRGELSLARSFGFAASA